MPQLALARKRPIATKHVHERDHDADMITLPGPEIRRITHFCRNLTIGTNYEEGRFPFFRTMTTGKIRDDFHTKFNALLWINRGLVYCGRSISHARAAWIV
jgi:hypothetical protein